MATAATVQPSPIWTGPVPIAPSQSQNKRKTVSREQLIKPKPMAADGPGKGPVFPKDGPCDACRKRKSRCAMNKAANKCYSCDFHRQDCVFTQNSQPRKKRFDNSANDVEILKRPLAESPTLAYPPFSHTSTSSSVAPSQSQPGSASVSGASTPPPYAYQSSQHIGMTTELEPLLLEHLPLDQNHESEVSSTRVRKYGDDGTFMKLVGGYDRVYEAQRATLDEIESLVAPYGPALVDKYFNFVHPSFPVLIEDVFRQSYKTRTELSSLLLSAVYILALHWFDAGTAMQNSRKPDIHRLEAISTKLLHDSLVRPHLSTIQAGLLLFQRPALNSSTLTAQLVTAGFELGLHQDCSSWKLDPWENGLRKRLAWALYVQDKWCSLAHGRPSHIFAANWTVKPLTEDDFESINVESEKSEDAPEDGHGPLLFTQMIVLTDILSDILDNFYTLKAAEEFQAAGVNQTRMILEKAKPVQIRLKDWFSRLPSFLKMDASIGDKVSSNGCLHLAYFATEITLHRCIIRSLNLDTADRYLSHICRSAAKTRLISAMDFVNRLRPGHLKSFWHFSSGTNFALIGAFGILLRATAPTMEEADFYRVRLGEYRWTLTVSSKSADFLDFAVESLDTSTGLLKNVPVKPAIAELMTSAAFAEASQSRPNLSPPEDENMNDAPSASNHGASYFDSSTRPEGAQGTSSNASGLTSPATSSSSSASGHDAYIAPYGNGVSMGSFSG